MPTNPNPNLSAASSTSPPISPPTTAATSSMRHPAAAPGIITTTSASSNRTICLDTGAPSINATPVEIDGEPTSPADQAAKLGGRDRAWPGALGGAAGASTARGLPGRKASFSPDPLAEEESMLEEFGLDGGRRVAGLLEKRAALLNERKSNPAVLVDIPQVPSVEEFAAANAAGAD
ncbi:uncharacterized protein K452DRAFT_304760 [Aplosporella prunicola CBS 121167]|uniref:Uncharacterized protein n=1 Tax=Aplosporella prunicola CBS 121167 TaxID=1176127 RepID=A0A6A6BS62_9PEZI|nr:uncharacterized protein K452DRAFT_304760 [Aplosporella prunicola CBS 121167]KAF2146840.1 hypothetical protein K452DRAFT_304760 [Aplosporella prunicola CBS 121167]